MRMLLALISNPRKCRIALAIILHFFWDRHGVHLWEFRLPKPMCAEIMVAVIALCISSCSMAIAELLMKVA